jgi:hypothetical protein
MPQASRVGDKDSNDEPLVEGSPTVFIGDSPGSIVIPTISVGSGTGVAFSVPSVTISPAQQAEANRQTQAYILNPSASRQNPAVTNNQVKENFPGTVIAVTHDRYFLDNVAGWILELDRGEGIPWEGNYSTWLEAKSKRLEQEEKTESKRRKTLEPIYNFQLAH